MKWLKLKTASKTLGWGVAWLFGFSALVLGVGYIGLNFGLQAVKINQFFADTWLIWLGVRLCLYGVIAYLLKQIATASRNAVARGDSLNANEARPLNAQLKRIYLASAVGVLVIEGIVFTTRFNAAA